MKEIAWRNKLCGKVITPEDWTGGILRTVRHGDFSNRVDGNWYSFSWGWIHGRENARHDTPIYPPRGWAGKSEDELFDIMQTRTNVIEIWHHELVVCSVIVEKNGCASFCFDEDHATQIPLDEIPISRMQNAQVLSSRLKGES